VGRWGRLSLARVVCATFCLLAATGGSCLCFSLVMYLVPCFSLFFLSCEGSLAREFVGDFSEVV